MLPDQWIPYLINKMGIEKDSLMEALIMISLLPLIVILILGFFI
jgi:transposase